MYYHRAWADIDLDALSHNLDRIMSLLPEGTDIMAVVKADAYGHGARAVARHLEGCGIWGFGVGDSGEALDLRGCGIASPILILGAIIEDEIDSVLDHDISVCVHSLQKAERLDRDAQRQQKRLKVHLMVDTGMGRLGVPPDRAGDVARLIASAPGLEFAGVATHYSSTHDPGDPFMEIQMRRFKEVRENLTRAGIYPGIYHASNSAAIYSSDSAEKNGHFDLVRPGISLYGINSGELPRPAVELKPVLSFRTQVIFLKDMPPGTPVGYNRKHVTTESTRVATLPIGYNDGFSFRLSGKGRVLIRGRSAPVIGTVTMDYTMVDVGAVPGVEVGDLVTLIGRDGDESVSVEEVARLVGTIPYEITCSIGKRVRRIPRKKKTETESEKETPLPAGQAESVR